MDPIAPIRSAQNARLKWVRAIRRGRERDFVLFEGGKVVADALESATPLELLLFDPEQQERWQSCLQHAQSQVECLPVEGRLLAEGSDLASSPGILAVARRPEASWSELASRCAQQRGVLLVAAGVQEPGNVGALVRVAAGLGACGVVFLQGGASPWHSRALRGASGTTFRIPVVEGLSFEQLQQECQQHGIEIWATAAAGEDYRRANRVTPIALLLGEEGQGLDAQVAQASDRCVGIALHHGVESLNVATAAAVLLAQLAPATTEGGA